MSRTLQNFDADWKFHLGDIPIKLAIKGGMTGGVTDTQVIEESEWLKIADFDERERSVINEDEWTRVDIPHDWCVEGSYIYDGDKEKQYRNHGYLPVGVGCYRKVFNIHMEDFGKKIGIEFEGVMRNSTVWVNGHLMGTHQSGYIGFFYDLTDLLRYGDEGENVIFVKVDASEYEGWWYEGCGIYRHVWLVKTNRLHVKRYGTYITTPTVQEEEAHVSIRTNVCNENPFSMDFTLSTSIVDCNGKIVGCTNDNKTINGDTTIEIESGVIISNPELWSPERPYLYVAVSDVIAEKKIIDSYKTTIGIRTIEFTPDKGFYLNRKPYIIKGTCNHQDFAAVGIALPDQITEYKIRLLKEMGSNAYRAVHHPPSPELLHLCDSMGMLVIDENRKLDVSPDGIKNLKSMLFRDRNHPSIIMWSLENEELLEGTKVGTRMLDTLSRITHKIDPTRPTVACMNHAWNEGGYGSSVDIMGYNYGQRNDQYIKDHEKYPDRIMIGSESSSCTTTRGEYTNNALFGYCSSYGDHIPEWACSHEKSWQDLVSYPFISGIFVWTGFDYRGEPVPNKYPCIGSHFGIMDSCGFPKDAYYYYKSIWTDEPTVHIFPHWNWPGKEGQQIDVWGYSNCETVELFLNDECLGIKVVDRTSHLDWKVIYAPGNLIAVGKNNGVEVIRKVVVTTGYPEKMKLYVEKIASKSEENVIVIIKVSIVDHNETIVPTADNEVVFNVKGNGKVIGVGNGNPSSHEPDKGIRRRAFNGHCMAIIQIGDGKGDVSLEVTSKSLASTSLVIN
ncbi:glycoside hydrolase family 2 protein [Cohnella endophytica]|uniref:Glycoside hydrolase family 2 protein n=1 Tax=Cohnella endophytica TaxID=2419778 RepID=A0A494XXI1_9BACL|nr:beta-galactosidase GalA [Cohnella endophytica]RKP54434.1 glycoside hydrolase family 2 protein [Cohnella endophytica]